MNNLNNVMKYSSNSRLRWYNSIYDENKNVVRIGVKDQRMIDKINSLSYSYWKIPSSMEYRPDLIANFHYGDPNLWWIITTANKIFHPLKELTTDRNLKIPSPSQVQAILII